MAQHIKMTATTRPIFIIDTDICSSTDDLFAMQLLYQLDREQIINLQAVMVSRKGLLNLRMADIMTTYYGRQGIRIGQPTDSPENPPVFIDYAKMTAPELYSNEPHFRRTLTDGELQALPTACSLYRQILSQSPNRSVHIVSVGFVNNLTSLLRSASDEYSPLNGIDLVRQKVAALHLQAGSIRQDAEPDFNFMQSPEDALQLMTGWPTPMYFSPTDAGDKFYYPNEEVLADLEETHQTLSPIYHVYHHHHCDSSQRMWDVMTILQWLHPELYDETATHLVVDSHMTLHQTDGEQNHFLEMPKEDAMEILMRLIRDYSKRG